MFGADPEVKKCYLIGSAAVKQELEAAGVECLGGGVGADGRGEAQCAGEAMTVTRPLHHRSSSFCLL